MSYHTTDGGADASEKSLLTSVSHLNSSDADSDVLADYVLALIRSDAPDDEIRKVSIENLEDFLRERALANSMPML